MNSISVTARRLPHILICRKCMDFSESIISFVQTESPAVEGSMKMQRFAPGLFDRLLDDHFKGAPATWTLDHLKDAVARDLESLLNTARRCLNTCSPPIPRPANRCSPMA